MTDLPERKQNVTLSNQIGVSNNKYADAIRDRDQYRASWIDAAKERDEWQTACYDLEKERDALKAATKRLRCQKDAFMETLSKELHENSKLWKIIREDDTSHPEPAQDRSCETCRYRHITSGQPLKCTGNLRGRACDAWLPKQDVQEQSCDNCEYYISRSDECTNNRVTAGMRCIPGDMLWWQPKPEPVQDRSCGNCSVAAGYDYCDDCDENYSKWQPIQDAQEPEEQITPFSPGEAEKELHRRISALDEEANEHDKLIQVLTKRVGNTDAQLITMCSETRTLTERVDKLEKL